MNEPGSNDLLQAAANDALVFTVLMAIIGLGCVFVGYRLFVSRVDAPAASGRPLFSMHRAGPGALVGLFGMAVIVVALWRQPSFDPAGGLDRSATSSERGSALIEATDVPSAAANRSTPLVAPDGSPNEDIGRKVRHDFDAPAGDRFFPSDEAAAVKPSVRETPMRGATGVQTKGAYVPFPRSSERTKANGTDSRVGSERNRRASALLSSNDTTEANSSNGLRAPFNIRIANP